MNVLRLSSVAALALSATQALGAAEVTITNVGPTTLCRNERGVVLAPELRPHAGMTGTLQTDGLIKAHVGDKVCYLFVSEAGSKSPHACSDAGQAAPSNTSGSRTDCGD